MLVNYHRRPHSKKKDRTAFSREREREKSKETRVSPQRKTRVSSTNPNLIRIYIRSFQQIRETLEEEKEPERERGKPQKTDENLLKKIKDLKKLI